MDVMAVCIMYVIQIGNDNLLYLFITNLSNTTWSFSFHIKSYVLYTTIPTIHYFIGSVIDSESRILCAVYLNLMFIFYSTNSIIKLRCFWLFQTFRRISRGRNNNSNNNTYLKYNLRWNSYVGIQVPSGYHVNQTGHINTCILSVENIRTYTTMLFGIYIGYRRWNRRVRPLSTKDSLAQPVVDRDSCAWRITRRKRTQSRHRPEQSWRISSYYLII